MKMIPMHTSEGLQEAAARILQKSLSDPEKRAVIKALFGDAALTKTEFFATAFAMGASSAFSELMDGNVIMVTEADAAAESQGNS